MNKLLAANFSRMLKNKFLYIGILVLGGAIAMQLYKDYTYVQSHPGEIISLDIFLLMYSKVAIIISSIFAGFFIGTEYSDKTIRNKIIVGHTRIAVYIANMITCVLATLIFFLTPMLVTVLAGLPISGVFTWSSKVLIQTILCSILTVIAFVSIFMLIVMLISNKAVGTITVLIITSLMIFSAVEVGDMLAEPEMIQGVATIGSDGVTIEYSEEPNPNYLDGTARKVWQVVYDCLPGGQISQYGGNTLPQNISMFPVYSFMVILVSSGAGILIFRKKNLK